MREDESMTLQQHPITSLILSSGGYLTLRGEEEEEDEEEKHEDEEDEDEEEFANILFEEQEDEDERGRGGQLPPRMSLQWLPQMAF